MQIITIQQVVFYLIDRIEHMKLQRNTHHVFRIMYHLMWIPKYRHKVFSEPYRAEMEAIIQRLVTTMTLI